MDKIDLVFAKLLLSLDRSLSIPQILPYLKARIINEVTNGLDKVTDQEAIEFLEKNGFK